MLVQGTYRGTICLVSGRTENVGEQFKFPRQKTVTPPAVAERGRHPERVRDRPIVVCRRDRTRVGPKVEVPYVNRVYEDRDCSTSDTRVLVVILILNCPVCFSMS